MHTLEKKTMTIGSYTLYFMEVLGKGATGTVYKGYHNTNQTSVAIKVIQLNTIKDDATKSLLDNEKAALKMVQNSNIIKLLDIIETNQCCYIVTQIHEGLTLKQYIAKKGMLSEEQSMTIFRKILNGCINITQNCIIHRDLKPANILINSQMEPKIIDFGFCEIITSKKVMRTFNVGSPSYMSPEAYLRTLYSQKSDSWSLGIILFQMLHGKTPDQRFPIKDYLQRIKNNPTYLPSVTNSLLNNNVKEILQKSLKYLPEERMSISGMKYLADVYCISINKGNESSKVSNFKNNNRPITSSIKNFLSVKEEGQYSLKEVPLIQKMQPHTLKNIMNDSSSEDKNGFITFSDFSKHTHSFSNRHKKASQISMAHTENKQSSINYISVRPNENNHLMANKFVQNINVPKVENYASFSGYQSLNNFNNVSSSSKEMMDRKIGFPAFRQITVRYL